MMNPVRTLGAAVVALAAPALLAPPAAADTRGAVAQIQTRLGDNTVLTFAVGSTGYDSYRRGDRYHRNLNPWGQTEWEVREMASDAVQACRQAVRQEARYLGYREVDFDRDKRVRQTGPRGFYVTFDEVEFEGRHRDRDARVSCEVRRGEVVSVEGLPRPDKGKSYRRGW